MKLIADKRLLTIVSVVTGIVFTAGVIALLHYGFNAFNLSDSSTEVGTSAPEEGESDSEIVRSSFAKDNFEFIYYGPDSRLFYTGTVTGNNGCAALGEVQAVNADEAVAFTVSIEYEGQICTQATKEILVQGSTSLVLTEEEALSLEQILVVDIKQLL